MPKPPSHKDTKKLVLLGCDSQREGVERMLPQEDVLFSDKSYLNVG
jgi:hypothetical protein